MQSNYHTASKLVYYNYTTYLRVRIVTEITCLNREKIMKLRPTVSIYGISNFHIIDISQMSFSQTILNSIHSTVIPLRSQKYSFEIKGTNRAMVSCQVG